MPTPCCAEKLLRSRTGDRRMRATIGHVLVLSSPGPSFVLESTAADASDE